MRLEKWLLAVCLFPLVGCSSDKPVATASGGASNGGSPSSAGAGAISGGAGSTGGTSGGSSSGGGKAGSGGGKAGSGGSGTLDPSVIAQQPEAIDELSLDASRVYWLEGHNRILSLPLAGGTPLVVYASTTPGKYETLHIALDQDNVYSTDQGALLPPVKPRGVFSVPKDGSGTRTQLLKATTIGSLALDGDYLYIGINGAIARMPRAGGSATALVRNIDDESPLAVHGGYVYFVYAPSVNDNQNVYRIAVDSDVGPIDAGSGGSSGAGGDSSVGGASSAGAPAIAAEKVSATTRYSELILSPHVDDDYVYWSIYDDLYRWPLAGGAQQKFGSLSSGSIDLLLVDHGDIYWGGGSINQFVVGGDSNTQVVKGIQGIHAVAVNASHLFVADGKLLRRVERP